MLDHAEAIAIQPFRVARVSVIELGKVSPDDFLAVGLAERVLDPAVRAAPEPFRMLSRQAGIDSGMIDDEVDHHLQPPSTSGGSHLADLFFGRRGAVRVQQGRVDLEIVGNRIETAGGARLLDGIDEHPVTAHRRRPGEMLAPAAKRPGQEGEKIVEGHGVRAVGRSQLSSWFIGRQLYAIAPLSKQSLSTFPTSRHPQAWWYGGGMEGARGRSHVDRTTSCCC